MDTRLNFLTFPQRFDGTRLHLRVLVVPRLGAAWDGDPLQPLVTDLPAPGDTSPAFADADLQLEAHVIDGLARFPVDTPVDLSAPLPDASGPASDARGLFQALVAPVAGRFALVPGPGRPAEAPSASMSVRKYLPPTYRDSFLFTGPRHPGARTDDSYACAVQNAPGPNPAFVTTPDGVSWGQIYAYCLRHPALAGRLGLIRGGSFDIDGRFADGGFVYVDLAGGSAYAAELGADASLVARYAARIPALTAGAPRPLFAAVQFPVLVDDPGVPGPPSPQGRYDQVFIEAADYDDGFAKIVHAVQPVSQNLLVEEPDGFPPVTDIGIRAAWDDEQILIWHARQLQPDADLSSGGTPQRLDAPLGAHSFRLDGREHGDAAWHSLVEVESKGPLTLDGIALGDPPDEPFRGELGVEVHPQQFDGVQPALDLWLPAYFAQWNGASPVLPDETAASLYKTEEAAGTSASLGRLYDGVGLDAIPLRYGRTYDLRVRISDPTGGGPTADDEPVNEGPAPTATVHFVRHVVPGRVGIADLPTFPDGPIDSRFGGDSLVVSRPLLGYPAVVFTGKYADPIPRLQAASDAAVGKGDFGIPDPDVQRIQIDVEVGTLRLDNLLSLSGRDPYIHLYTTTRPLPADVDADLTVPLTFVDAAVLHAGDPNDFGDLDVTQAEIDGRADLPLPTEREIRLTIRAVAGADPAYFAPGAEVGRPVQVRLRRPSTDERSLFAAASPARTIRGLWLRPDPAPTFDGRFETLLTGTPGDTGAPAIVPRLAAQIDVDVSGMTLVGRRGERIVFGCGRGIRHTLAPDNSSLTFAAKDDLVNHWIVAITVQIDRDWTWDGLAPLAVDVVRTRRFGRDAAPAPEDDQQVVGQIGLVATASLLALDGADRDRTRLVFLDAVEPKAADPAKFPDVVDLDYRLVPRYTDAPAQSDAPLQLQLTLPVTTPPAQVPRIVAAGLALSPYQRNETYSATEPRQRSLWIELDQPPADPDDAYFIRLLGYAPDLLLSDDRIETLQPPEETSLPIDPELVRVITPGQSDDHAGLNAMTQLVAADDSPVHFLVPLPAGVNVDSPELFGMFTYELRVGHAEIWSTAQGRFGRTLRSTGVQHPAPTLFCTCRRTVGELVVEAPFATAVLHGQNITADPPRTQLWALLYAQVRQADGADWRNVLLDDRRLVVTRRLRTRFDGFQNRDAVRRGVTAWKQDEIEGFLAALGLAPETPISVLCVEMMPTLASMQPPATSTTRTAGDAASLYGAVLAQRGATSAVAVDDSDDVHPLSDGLGHFRILRTSPLTAVPAVC